jgi:pilus assembly protein Flp/PilA
MRTDAANVPRLLLTRFAADTQGATAIEYAMIAAGVGATIAGVVYNLGSHIEETFYDKLSNVIK